MKKPNPPQRSTDDVVHEILGSLRMAPPKPSRPTGRLGQLNKRVRKMREYWRGLSTASS